MKVKELKHNHSLTDLLKIILFSILMLLPFLAVGTRCLYVICNKNAYQSYSNKNMMSSNTTLTSTNMLNVGDILTYTYINGTATNSQTGIVTYSQLSFNPTDYGWDDNAWTKISIINNGTSQYIYLHTADGTFQAKNIWGSTITSFSIVVDSWVASQTLQIYNTQVTKQTYVPNALDNVFDYSMNQMANDPLFNWTQNTGVYTGVSAMCTGMEITNPVIPILITYWTLLTCIYIIIDIVLKCFTTLTHMLGSRISQ